MRFDGPIIGGGHKPAQSGTPFVCLFGPRSKEIVEAAASMGIDIPEGGLFLCAIKQDAGQNNVFEDVGEIAGVEIVPVVHLESAKPGDAIALERDE